MSNKIIYCFNKPEGNEDELVGQCIYAKCGMFSEELDLCKLELLKGEKVAVNPFNLDVKPIETTNEPIPTTQLIINKILEAKPGLTEETVKTLIEIEIAKAAGLLTEEAATHLVATNLGLYADEQLDAPRLISSLKEGEKSSKANPINIKGTLVFDPIQNDVNTRKGPATVTSIIIKDDSGEAKISFWGDNGKGIMDFAKGDKLFFDGLFLVKGFYDDKPQIVGGKYYKVAKLN